VLPSGYSSILRPLGAQIPKQSILTKCPVKKIHWKRKKTFTGLETVDENSEDEHSDDSERTVTEVPTGGLRGGSVESNSSGNCDSPAGHVRVDCEDGRVFHAAHVICTIPLGVLKSNHRTLFDPVLPQFKQESIENLMFGTVDKIFLEYERPFLSADISEIMLLWDDDKRDMNSTEEELASEAYLSKNWFKKIYSFAKVTDTLLLGWVSGREAEFMETLPHEAVAEKCTEILRNFLQDPYVPKPKRCVW